MIIDGYTFFYNCIDDNSNQITMVFRSQKKCKILTSPLLKIGFHRNSYYNLHNIIISDLTLFIRVQ